MPGSPKQMAGMTGRCRSVTLTGDAALRWKVAAATQHSSALGRQIAASLRASQ
jgi:hypothetical protein